MKKINIYSIIACYILTSISDTCTDIRFFLNKMVEHIETSDNYFFVDGFKDFLNKILFYFLQKINHGNILKAYHNVMDSPIVDGSDWCFLIENFYTQGAQDWHRFYQNDFIEDNDHTFDGDIPIEVLQDFYEIYFYYNIYDVIEKSLS